MAQVGVLGEFLMFASLDFSAFAYHDRQQRYLAPPQHIIQPPPPSVLDLYTPVSQFALMENWNFNIH